MVPSHGAIAVVLGLTAAAVAQPQAGFWFPGLAPGATTGNALGLSQDGRIAVGSSGAIPFTSGYTWTRDGGRSDFGLLPGMPTYTPASAVSSDGSALAGMTQFSAQQGLRAYRWNGSGVVQDLGLLSNETRSYANGISGDGSVVVGACEHTPNSEFAGQAFRWTPQGGMQGLGYTLPSGTFSEAEGISRDGSTIVGISKLSGVYVDAFAWTPAGGMHSLPSYPGISTPNNYARAVDADGSVIVGDGPVTVGGNSRHALRWSGGQAQDLGVLSGYVDCVSFATSDDGSVVGGQAAAGVNYAAWVWTPATGMHLLSDYLASAGVSVPGNYRLEEVHAISGDGLTFAGICRNLASNTREGFVATVPAPGSVLILLLPAIAHRRRR
jgi:probable HAF family extracellular repeat protein